MSRLYDPPEAIAVMADAVARPTYFIWRKGCHPVQSIPNRWRLDWGWWWALHKSRDYFLVRTSVNLQNKSDTRGWKIRETSPMFLP